MNFPFFSNDPYAIVNFIILNKKYFLLQDHLTRSLKHAGLQKFHDPDRAKRNFEVFSEASPKNSQFLCTAAVHVIISFLALF